MRFTKFGKALCMGALSAGIIFGVASCVESYAVGYLFVTGTLTAQSGNNGVITGFQIDHNTGQLIELHGFPISSGGANPVRAVLVLGSRFVYVLNRGVNAAGNGDCTSANPCQSPNITQFVVGGNGILTYQQTFYTQGRNPFRLLADAAGAHLFVLDHDAPDSNEFTGANATSNSCSAALGSGVTSCGDITVLQIDQTTGRLSTVTNAAVTSQNCPNSSLSCPLTYFPVPANPVDFVLAGTSAVLTLTGASAPASYPYTGGTAVWPYVNGNGQLTLSQSGVQALSIHQGNALVFASNVLYVLDNEPVTVTFNKTPTTSASQILPFSVGAGGALSAEPSGVIPDAPCLANPTYLLVESKGQYLYLANAQGNPAGANCPNGGIAGYFLTTSPSYQLSFIPDEPFGSGSGPQCIVEDPSDQYIYEANQNDSTVTGQVLEPETGTLTLLRVNGGTYSLPGQPTWCFVDGRTG